MTRLHTVLATTDLSAPARHAAQRAAMLASETGARLELLHVLEKSALDELQQVFIDQDAALSERIREMARDALSQLATDIGEPLGVTAGLHLDEGAVLEAIAAEADRLDASLLVPRAPSTSRLASRRSASAARPSACCARCVGRFWPSSSLRANITGTYSCRLISRPGRPAPCAWPAPLPPRPS